MYLNTTDLILRLYKNNSLERKNYVLKALLHWKKEEWELNWELKKESVYACVVIEKRIRECKEGEKEEFILVVQWML